MPEPENPPSGLHDRRAGTEVAAKSTVQALREGSVTRAGRRQRVPQPTGSRAGGEICRSPGLRALVQPTGTSQSGILTLPLVAAAAGATVTGNPHQRLRPWAARGADDVDGGVGLPASRAAAAPDQVGSGVAGGGLRGRRVCRGGWAAEEERDLPPPPSRPSEFPGLPQPSPGVGALAYCPARGLASSPAAGATPGPL